MRFQGPEPVAAPAPAWRRPVRAVAGEGEGEGGQPRRFGGGRRRGLALQHAPPCGDARRAVVDQDAQGVVDGFEERRRKAVTCQGEGGRHGVGLHLEAGAAAVHGRGGGLAGDRPVHHPAQGVEVGPGALALAAAEILLEGGVTVGEQGGEAAGPLAHGVAGGAEIQQDGAAVPAQIDVARLEIPMDHPGVVDIFEAVQDRHEHIQQRLFGEVPAFFDVGGETLPLLVDHHQIGGLVEFEKVDDLDDVGVAETGQGLRLLEKPLQPHREGFGVPGGAGTDGRVGLAAGELLGEKLLDGDRHPQAGVHGQVGQSERPLSQDGIDPVLKQHGSCREGVRVGLGHGFPLPGQVAAMERSGQPNPSGMNDVERR